MPSYKISREVKGEKKMTKNSIDRCCSCSISGIWICPLVLYQSGGGIRKRIYETGRKERKGAAM